MNVNVIISVLSVTAFFCSSSNTKSVNRLKQFDLSDNSSTSGKIERCIAKILYRTGNANASSYKSTSSFTNKHAFFTAIEFIVVPVMNVQKKKYEGYRLVKYKEVDYTGGLRGTVMQMLSEQNYYNRLKLDGGELLLRRRCRSYYCDKAKITFELVPKEYKTNEFYPKTDYAIMLGITIHLILKSYNEIMSQKPFSS